MGTKPNRCTLIIVNHIMNCILFQHDKSLPLKIRSYTCNIFKAGYSNQSTKIDTPLSINVTRTNTYIIIYSAINNELKVIRKLHY